MNSFFAELIGTALLILLGNGVVAGVVLRGTKSENGGWIVITFAWALAVTFGVYAVGRLSGAHLNPAVTIGLWMGGRIKAQEILPYVAAQVLGGIAGAGVLYIIVTGNGSDIGSFAANGYDDHSPGGYNMVSAIATELVMTFMFMLIILGSTDDKAPKGFAGLAIGLALTLIHLISIPVTNTSVNPARSISQAIFVGDWALSQLWLFVLIPIAGAALAGLVYKFLKS